MQKPTKICYILPDYNKNTDSHFFHLYELLEELSKKIDIFLIVEKSNVGHVEIGKKSYVQKFKFVPLRFLESFFAVLYARVLGYKNFYTHYCYIGGINAIIISRLSGGKSYYWNCEPNWLLKRKGSSQIGLNLNLKLSDFLVTCGEKMKQGYAEHCNLKPDKIKVMPNWVNLERFQVPRTGFSQPQKTKIILFVHWLSERKGAHLLVPIVLSLCSRIDSTDPGLKNFKLLVIGGGPLKEKILKEIKNNKIDDFIEVLGEIPNKEIIKYYAMADIFIMPSLLEGFGRVLLEAMAMGIPYVSSDTTSLREISPPTGRQFLVEPGNIEEFAEKILILLKDQGIYERFRKEELEKIKEYSLNNTVNKFINLFI
jgi:glycosyltransferase involved in cell wall biosynthesis